jgi:hypothetical protein
LLVIGYGLVGQGIVTDGQHAEKAVYLLPKSVWEKAL